MYNIRIFETNTLLSFVWEFEEERNGG